MVKQPKPVDIELSEGKTDAGYEYIEYRIKQARVAFIAQETPKGWWVVYRLSTRPCGRADMLTVEHPGQKGLADCFAQERVAEFCADWAPDRPVPKLR